MRDPGFAEQKWHARRHRGEVKIDNMTMFSGFDDMLKPLYFWARETPYRPFLKEWRDDAGWETLTFHQALQSVERIAGSLASLVWSRDPPLLILAPNSIRHALITYACLAIGKPVAPISLQYGLKNSNPKRLDQILDTLGADAAYIDDPDQVPMAMRAIHARSIPTIGSKVYPGSVLFSELLEGNPYQASLPFERPAKLLLTSGSTGHPKAVVLTHEAIAANAAQVAACFHEPWQPVMYNCAPWSHSLGANAILHVSLHRGGTLYIDPGKPTASGIGKTIKAMKDVSPTFHNMVPAGWPLLIEALEADGELASSFFKDLRVMQYGGAALPTAVYYRVQKLAERTVGAAISFGSGYGATETGPTLCNVHWPNRLPGLIGLPIPGTQLRLKPVGDVYELWGKGPQLFSGYWSNGEISPPELDEEGYLNLGDSVGFVDAADPLKGLTFEGRLVENFKLMTGTFVQTGKLRVELLAALSELAAELVICGEGQGGLGLMVFPKVSGENHKDKLSALRKALQDWNENNHTSSRRIQRAMVLTKPPNPHHGEISEKGYLNQSKTRLMRASEIERLYADDPDAEILAFEKL